MKANKLIVMGLLIGLIVGLPICIAYGVWQGNKESTSKQVRAAKVYLKANNFKNVPVENVVATQHTKTKSETGGIKFVIDSTTTKSDSYKEYRISKIEYRLNGKNKEEKFKNDSDYFNVTDHGELLFSKQIKSPRLSVSSYVDKETSKNFIQINRNIRLTVPEDYEFSQEFDFGSNN